MKIARFNHLFTATIVASLIFTVAWISPFGQAAPQAQTKENLKASSSNYLAMKSAADAFYAKGNYGQAAAGYQAALKAAPIEEEKWIRFRLADATWRGAEAESKEPPSAQDVTSSKMVWARQALERLIGDLAADEKAGMVSAECQESLGDYWTQPGPNFNWYKAWPYYQSALDWWSGSTDIATARVRYLAIAFKCARPFEAGLDGLPANGAGPPLPLREARGALKIARTNEQKVHAQFLVALALMQSNDPMASAQIAEAFEASLALRKQCPWYAAALYWYAFWSGGGGAPAQKTGVDCGRAADLFRQLSEAFSGEETPFYAKAQRWLDEHGRNPLQITVSSNFLPGVFPEFSLRFLRQRKVRFALYPVNLAQGVLRWNADAATPADGDWTNILDLNGIKPIKTWEKEFQGPLACDFVVERVTMDWAPPAGAYVLEAAGARAKARALILVTKTAVVVKRSGPQVVVFVCDAVDGSPVEMAKVRLLDVMNGTWHAETNASQDGLARLNLPEQEINAGLVVLASYGPKQTFSISRPAVPPSSPGAPIFDVVSDKPAYRPGEKVQWKVTMRRASGRDLATPAGERIAYVITSPKQTKVKEGLLTLNAFGSAWDDLELGAQSALGEYQIEFYGVKEEGLPRAKGNEEGGENEAWKISGEEILPMVLGEATLFRLEEYKLPEFSVVVNTAVGGKPKVFSPSEPVTATIQANYYSGEAVAEAAVEVAVYQRYYARPHPSPEGIPWLDEDRAMGDFGPADFQLVQRENVTTDEAGHADYAFQPRDSKQDVEYKIEARVTDASRRMAAGEAVALVSRRTSYASLSTGGTVFRVGESMSVHVRLTDAYGNPKPAKGTLALSRTEIRETWLDPEGRIVEKEALLKARALYPKFPPPPKKPGARGWVLYSQHSEEVKVQTKEIVAGTSGEESVVFMLPKEGPYQLRWSDELGNEGGQDEQVALLVAGAEAKPLCLASGAFQIILAKPTVRPGERARALIVSPFRKGHILVGMDGEDLHGVRVVPLSGTAAVVDIEVGGADAPCAYFCADMVSGLKLYSASQKIVVPALDRVVKVSLEPDRETYLPRQPGTWHVKTFDTAGKPVQAEVSLGVVDDAVFAIQSEYARDPRSVFLAWQRFPLVATNSAFDRNYINPPPKPLSAVAADQEIAYNGTGIKGRITDISGQPIPGATIKASGTNLSGLWMTATDAQGIYTLDLPSGKNYVVQVEAQGYNSVVRSGIEVVGGTATNLPFQLGSGSSTITVVGAAPIIDAKRTETGAVVSDKLLNQSESEGGVEGGVEGRVEGGTLGGEIAYMAPSTVAENVPPLALAPNPVIVRHDFDTTAFWQPGLVTDASGSASIQFKYPESLTRWRATARAATSGSDFGVAEFEVRTHQDLTVRLQCPRFLVAGDEATISAVIQNSGERELVVSAELKAQGVRIDERGATHDGTHIPGKGTTRVDWRVTALAPGDASFEARAVGAHVSDAMARTIPVLSHGLEVMAGATGSSSEGDVVLRLNLPKERAPLSTSMEMQISLGPVTAVLDALPYLMGYPYGCTEQTMSRFLPCVVAAGVLKKQGLTPEAAANRILGPAREDQSHGLRDGSHSGIESLADMTDKGLARLYGFHHPDGGWGWWEMDASDPFMTAYVLSGLCTARASGIEVADDVLRQAQEFLLARLSKKDADGNLMAWMLYAVASSHAEMAKGEKGGPEKEPPAAALEALQGLWERRTTLTPYGQALLALSAYDLGRADWAKGLARDLEKSAKSEQAEKGQRLAFWGEQGSWWRWSLGPTETTACALRALLAADPKSPLVAQAAAWLLVHRTGPQWSNTRDTALAVLALNDYIVRANERPGSGRLDVHVNGHLAKRLLISADEPVLDETSFHVDPSLLRDGENEIVVQRKSGGGPLFVSALERFYSLEEPVKSAGAGLAIVRKYTLLKRVPTLLKGDIIVRQEIKDGGAIASGDRVECSLTLKADQDADYVLVEDFKPAGLESIEVRSGGQLSAHELSGGSRTQKVYEELRDTKVVFFLAHVPAGAWEMQYELYAETPGIFHVMPAQAQAMYAPHIKGNSEEIRLTVQ